MHIYRMKYQLTAKLLYESVEMNRPKLKIGSSTYKYGKTEYDHTFGERIRHKIKLVHFTKQNARFSMPYQAWSYVAELMLNELFGHVCESQQ